MKVIMLLFLMLVVSCSQGSNINTDKKAQTNENSFIDDNIVHDMPLEEALAKYEENPCIDIIKNFLK